MSKPDLKRIGVAVVAIVAVFSGGTIGFHEILHEPWHDAFYRTAVTTTLTGPRLDSARGGRRVPDDRACPRGRGYLWLPGGAGRRIDRS